MKLSSTSRVFPVLPVLFAALWGCSGTEEEIDEDAIAGGESGGAFTMSGGSGGDGSLLTGGSGATLGTGGAIGTGGAGGTGGIDTGTGGAVNAGTGGQGSGGEPPSPYGPVSCSPVFEDACKPPIEFENQEPEGRGKIFNTVVPDVVATMQDTACTVCSILYRDPSEIPENKHPSKIRLVLDFHGGVAQAGGDQIQFDLNYIDGYSDRSEDDARTEMLGVLMHETVHLYQNYGNGGTGEGMADYVRIRTGLYGPGRRNPGGSWKDAYTTSGFFYSWLAGPCDYHMDARAEHNKDLGYLLNEVLGMGGDPYDNVNSVLQAEFGKSADELWAEYQDAL